MSEKLTEDTVEITETNLYQRLARKIAYLENENEHLQRSLLSASDRIEGLMLEVGRLKTAVKIAESRVNRLLETHAQLKEIKETMNRIETRICKQQFAT